MEQVITPFHFTFQAFPKIPRLFRDMVITEKIDGTNAQILITDDNHVYAGSRNRWITPDNDNFGFARWVAEHETELLEGLGPGLHYGEWWGAGIQRGYGLKEKRFSLFNTGRWNADNTPACVGVVPVLYEGLFDIDDLRRVMSDLIVWGSKAAPGYNNPEGIVIYHTAANQMFKVTIDNDGKPKGLAE